jgi:hypothetical protein
VSVAEKYTTLGHLLGLFFRPNTRLKYKIQKYKNTKMPGQMHLNLVGFTPAAAVETWDKIGSAPTLLEG